MAGAALFPSISLTLETFDTTADSGVVDHTIDPISTASGVDIFVAAPVSGPAATIDLFTAGVTTVFNGSTKAVQWRGPSQGAVTFDFMSTVVSPVNAFGIQIWDIGNDPGAGLFGPAPTTLTLVTSNGAIISHTFPAIGPGTGVGFMSYVGIIDRTMSFVSATISSDNFTDELQFDDLRFGAVPSTPPPGGMVPEPTSLALFGLTALGMALGARRKKRKTELVENTSAA